MNTELVFNNTEQVLDNVGWCFRRLVTLTLGSDSDIEQDIIYEAAEEYVQIKSSANVLNMDKYLLYNIFIDACDCAIGFNDGSEDLQHSQVIQLVKMSYVVWWDIVNRHYDNDVHLKLDSNEGFDINILCDEVSKYVKYEFESKVNSQLLSELFYGLVEDDLTVVFCSVCDAELVRFYASSLAEVIDFVLGECSI